MFFGGYELGRHVGILMEESDDTKQGGLPDKTDIANRNYDGRSGWSDLGGRSVFSLMCWGFIMCICLFI